MDPSDIRRWSENHAAVTARELKEMRRNPLSPSDAFKAAMSLLEFDEACNGSPFERRDDLEAQDDQRKWDAWTKLRANWNSSR
ncbi:MAG TPA: hypothetical protein VN380_02480 [Thermoanaerobaculia bacterium]|jgi:hypothetical protein|nr:hypothetical protein [Thermoanaerobaculia bacterium]